VLAVLPVDPSDKPPEFDASVPAPPAVTPVELADPPPV
jgi:hypothetical protein